jgi:hypothetical protein
MRFKSKLPCSQVDVEQYRKKFTKDFIGCSPCRDPSEKATCSFNNIDDSELIELLKRDFIVTNLSTETKSQNQWARNLFNSLGDGLQKIIAQWITLWNVLLFMFIIVTFVGMFKKKPEPEPVTAAQPTIIQIASPVGASELGEYE